MILLTRLKVNIVYQKENYVKINHFLCLLNVIQDRHTRPIVKNK